MYHPTSTLLFSLLSSLFILPSLLPGGLSLAAGTVSTNGTATTNSTVGANSTVVANKTVVANSTTVANSTAVVDSSCICYETKCFCGEEAKKMKSCIDPKNPNFPFLEKVEDKGDCPNILTDPKGFAECLKKKLPKMDPNAKKIFNDCAESTKATPTANQKANSTTDSAEVIASIISNVVNGEEAHFSANSMQTVVSLALAVLLGLWCI